jgi:LPS-assembly lipoprotein
MALVLGLQGCGFALRSSQNFVFDTVAVTPERSAGVAAELNRYLGARVRPLVPPAGGLPPDAVVDILQEAREKIVVGVNASGQEREFQLRLRVRFRLRSPDGAVWIDEVELAQQRDLSFTETAALSKEIEQAMIYRDMQTDIVQQIMRRLAMVKRPEQAAPRSAVKP